MPSTLAYILSALPLLAITASASNPHDLPAHRRHHGNIAARGEQFKRSTATKSKRCKPRTSSLVASSTTVAASTSTHAAATTSTAKATSAAATTAAPANVEHEASTTSKEASTKVTTSKSAATTTKSSSSGSSSGGSLSPPNGRKAGLAGGNAFDYLKDKIGWWYDWTADPKGHSGGGTISVAMLWGGGGQSGSDASRLASYKSNVLSAATVPNYVLGFNEPDCTGSASSNLSPTEAAGLWKSLIAPVGDRGALLGSPAMCYQAGETWLAPFEAALGGSRSWDFTAVHIYTDNMDDVKATLNHYASYGRPMWVTEFGCVHKGFTPCYSQSDIDSFIYNIVDVFESDSRVHAYGYTDGGGLGDLWLPTNNGGYGTGLSASGQTYQNAIAKYA